MKIIFEKIRIHHFLSFDDSTINLQDAGYVLVSGINKNPLDAAKSNGSGKSTIWNAICYALTGETIQGLKTNIANIYTNDGCFVELSFKVDRDSYRIIRSKDTKEYGTNLKIFINDIDKSGKGIRESQQLLEQYLPDLTSDLIGSVIILGQGLPHKFSDNTPSGRKEILEKLSKSDFMIQDIKNKINLRSFKLDGKLRLLEDENLKLNTELKMFNSQLEQNNNLLNNLSDISCYENDLKSNKENKEIIENKLNNNNSMLLENKKELDIENNKLININNQLNEESNKVKDSFVTDKMNLNEQKILLMNEINNLKNEINRLKNIKDVCPTCGQKLPNVVKPDTSEQENKLNLLENNYKNILENIDKIDLKQKDELKEVEIKFNKDIEEVKNNIQKITNIINTTELEIKDFKLQLDNINKKILIIENDINSYFEKKKSIEDSINKLETDIDKTKILLEENDKKQEELNEHLDIINKIVTLVKRDFRGYLLNNVIEFINSKSKEYCSYVFDTNKVDIVLEGNNINIYYCNKNYENLSGGEKQKLDLIIQFAIRDMLCTYLSFSSNILVLDEIFDNLDSVGCNKVLNLISDKLKDVESIFIITHHQEDLAIPNDYELVVEKDEKGLSRIV